MYKHFTKQDWEKALELEGCTLDYFITAGNGKRENEIETFKKVLSKYTLDKPLENLKDSFFKNVYTFTLKGKNIWFEVVYGGAYLSELTHIACTFGSKKNYILGSCGGLQDNLKSGDIILPTYSYGDESTTRMYQEDVKDNKHYSNEKLRKEIFESIDSKYNVHEGPIVTCQGMLAETQEDISRWGKEGYLGVEMETSTLFAVSNYFNIPSISILNIGDNLVKNELVGSEEYERGREFRNEIKEYKYKLVFENILKD